VLKFPPVFALVEVAYASELDPVDCAERHRSDRLSLLNDFGRLGRAYCEASEDRSDLETTISDLETTISDLIAGQYDNPVRVVAFNTAERWSEDVSEYVAREIMRRLGLAGDHRLRASSTGISVPTVSLPCGLAL
jgi:hypothetical protein